MRKTIRSSKARKPIIKEEESSDGHFEGEMITPSKYDQVNHDDSSPTTLYKTPSTTLVNRPSLDDSMVIYTNTTTVNQSPIPSSTPPPPSSIIHDNNDSQLNQSVMEEEEDDDDDYIHIPSQIQNMSLNSSNTSDYEYFGSPMMTMMSTPPSIAYQQRLEHLQLIDDNNTQYYSPNTPKPIPSSTPAIIKKSSQEDHISSNNSNNSSFTSTNSTLNSSRLNNLSLQLDISQINELGINEMSNIPNSVIEEKLKELKQHHHYDLKSSPLPNSPTAHSSLNKNYTATVDTDRLLSFRSSTSRRAMHVHRDDILKYVRAIQDPDDQVRKRAIEIVKLLDATMRPPSPEKTKKNPNFEHIQSRVSHNPKTIPKDVSSSSNNLYSDFKSKLKMTRNATSRFRECFDQQSEKVATRREQVELEKQEFLKKCPRRSHK